MSTVGGNKKKKSNSIYKEKFHQDMITDQKV